MDAYCDQIRDLKSISYDSSHKEYMTNSLREIYNFDLVKRKYTNSLEISEEACSSCDGLLWSDTEKVLIEFKNGKNINSNEIKLKILNSLLILCDINNINITDTRREMEFILVYNSANKPVSETEKSQFNSANADIIEESTSKDFICKYILRKANTEYRRFGLSVFIGMYFKDVHTYDIEEFDNWLVSI